MKKKLMKIAAIAGLLVALPVFAFAAGSPSNSSGDDSDSGSSNSGYVSGGVHSVGTVTQGGGVVTPTQTPGQPQSPAQSQAPTTTTVDAYGTQSTGASTVITSRGTVSVKTNGLMTNGTVITYDQSNGNAVYGGSEIEVRTGAEAVAGLSESTKNTNAGINTAGTLSGVVAGAEGSKTITEGLNINILDKATGVVNDTWTEITLKIDYLDASMQNLSIGGYANASQAYMMGQVISVDYAKKLVVVRIPGSGTYWVSSK